ncbi:hypothetical protein RND71_010139 [Anisodus tanguticus]|uniref:C2H2-type domain-containing protein n=1 Tax=Anisodus tanguticus TaxID=243964 RepID=A0AAE1SH74_9SOLA|nr:hypothetical protein RND71_010139 [Anisodus tanguticus]
MTEAMDVPVDDVERRRERSNKSPESSPRRLSPPHRRGRRDDRDFDNRGGRGDYYDRNRSPPPQERDYKPRRPSFSPSPLPYRNRRGGHSPSPPSYRDRRGGHSPSPSTPYRNRRGGHSLSPSPPLYRDRRGGRSLLPPPHRRSPPFPPYKRCRRDDYHGRRGRGRDYGPDDQRYGYDYQVGYERKTGGRLGYHDERPHGQFVDHSSDRDAGRDGFADALGAGSGAGSNQRRNELARKLAKDFVLDLQSGVLDLGPRVTPVSANKPGQSSEPNSDEEADDGGKRRRHGRGPTKDTDLLSAAPKAHQVSPEPRRIQIDIEQAQELSDNERGSRDKSHGDTSGPVVIIRGLTSVKGLEGTELLDTLVTYLWRIHGVDYYGMTETNEAEGLRHAEGAGSFGANDCKGKIDAAAIDSLDPQVRKIRDEKYGWKYGCGAKGCTKFFNAADFVHKHLKLKHLDLMMELTSKVPEYLYFQNYMNYIQIHIALVVLPEDAHHYVEKEKALSHRLVPVKDDRGNRRDLDGRGIGGERFDRSENPQSGNFQSKNGGASPGNPDEHMFDAFGGQGISVAPFSSDIAPPSMLIPVPGAG